MIPELPIRDIHLPDPISWWPLAWGYWLLLAVSLILISFVTWWVMRPTLRKEALKALDTIENAFQESDNGAECVADLSALFRRIVISKNNRASITGVAWLSLLDRQLKTSEFSQGIGKMLVSGPYQPYVHPEEVEKLLELSRRWVQRL